MLYNLLIQDEAVVEAQFAFESYERKKKGLGFELIKSLERAYMDICKGPKFYSFIDTKKVYRRISLDRFPCMIIYELEGYNIIIVAIRFERENPEKRKSFTR